MLKGLIAGATALSLVMTPLQAQEFDNNDIAKLVAGLLAAGALSAAWNSERDDDTWSAPKAHAPRKRHEAPVVRREQRINPRYEPPVVDHATRSRHRDRWTGRIERRDYGGLQDHAPQLPATCLRAIETRFGVVRMFASRCLERTFARAGHLPRRCAVRVMSTNGPRNGYDPYCLRENGFRMSRR